MLFSYRFNQNEIQDVSNSLSGLEIKCCVKKTKTQSHNHKPKRIDKSVIINGVPYEIGGTYARKAVNFLLEKENCQASTREFFSTVYDDEKINDLPGALDADVKIKSVNQTLEKRGFPFRIRKDGGTVALKK